MDETIEVSKDLWLVVEDTSLQQDGLFSIRDGVGGNTLIDVDEIPRLIEALQKVQERMKTLT